VDIIKKFNNKNKIEEIIIIIENNEEVLIQDIEIMNKTIIIGLVTLKICRDKIFDK